MAIELRFEPTFRDVVGVLRAISRVQPSTRILRWTGWAALGAGALGLLLRVPATDLVTTLLAAGILVLLILWLLPLSFAWMTRSGSPLWKGEQLYELDDRGIRTTHASARSFLAWSALRKVVETRRAFLLFTSTHGACFIPKGALSAGQAEAVRRLLADHTGSGRIVTAPTPDTGDAGEDARFTGRFTWTTRELYQASLAMAFHGSRVWLVSVIFMALLVALNGGPYVYGRVRDGGLGSLSVGLVLLYAFPLLFVLALAPVTAWWSARQMLRTRRASQGEQLISIGDGGIRTSGGVHDGAMAWDAFTRVVETRDLYLFCLGKLSGLAVPVRAFQPEQTVALRALLSEKLGRRYVRKAGHRRPGPARTPAALG